MSLTLRDARPQPHLFALLAPRACASSHYHRARRHAPPTHPLNRHSRRHASSTSRPTSTVSSPQRDADEATQRRRQSRKNAPMQWHLSLNNGGGNTEAKSWRHAPESRRDFPKFKEEERERVQHVPFEGAPSSTSTTATDPVSTSPPAASSTQTSRDKDPNSTMTPRERRAFQSLFSSYSSRPLANLDPKAPDTTRFFAKHLDAPPITSFSNKTRTLPAELRAMAAQAQRAQERRRKAEADQVKERQAEEGWEEAVREVEGELYAARTDVEVWEVLWRRVLGPLGEIDAVIKQKTATQDTKTAGTAPILGTDGPHPIAMGCSHLFTLAMRILARRTSYTPYAALLLPTIESHTFTTSVLGISTPLYNECLSHAWRFRQDLPAISRLLEEMDVAGLDPDQETLDLLRQVCGWLQRAQQGAFGVGVQAVEGLVERRKDAQKAFGWRDEVKRRLDGMAVAVSEREEQERRLLGEGLLDGDEEGEVEEVASVG